MREIRFRGKRVDCHGKDGSINWVYGHYLYSDNKHWIVTNSIGYSIKAACKHDAFEVIPETVCQFTGLTDRNNVDIYEGDIVGVGDHDTFGPIEKRVVVWSIPDAAFLLDTDYLNEFHKDEIEVVGNIFENKELLSAHPHLLEGEK